MHLAHLGPLLGCQGPCNHYLKLWGPLGEHQKLLTALALGEKRQWEEHGTVSQAELQLKPFCTHNLCVTLDLLFSLRVSLFPLCKLRLILSGNYMR